MGLVLHGPSVQGPGILGNRTFMLQAALGARPPNDTYPSCPAPTPFVLKACPGAAPAPVCVPGARSLTGLESGCCACRRTRATVPVRQPALLAAICGRVEWGGRLGRPIAALHDWGHTDSVRQAASSCSS